MSELPDPLQPFERPPGEAWWESELLRKEKLMDKYLQVLGQQPDWENWANPQAFYNAVHFGIGPSNSPEPGPADFGDNAADEEDEEEFVDDLDEIDDADFASDFEDSLDEWVEDDAFDDEDLLSADSEADESEDAGYREIAEHARNFAVHVFEAGHLPRDTEVFYLAAGKIGAHLAGGHGLGYDDESICGNIVKCRWALADCEFCREMLEHLLQREDLDEVRRLVLESERLGNAIRERIAGLRSRVWW